MSNVRAKFRCDSKNESAPGGETYHQVSFSPVDENMPGGESGNACEENKIFGEATPAGSIEMTIRNPAAAEKFTPGPCYFVDFTPA